MYVETALKLIMGFLTMVIQINLSGKSNLAPSTVIDQMQNFVLGGIIGGVIYNQDITILQFFIVLLIWSLIVFVAKFLTNHNRHFKSFIDGKPTVLISDGRLLSSKATQKSVSAHDLSLMLRQAGVADISEVKRAILEESGQLTVIRSGDSNIKFPLIMDGEVDDSALALLGYDRDWLDAQLKTKSTQNYSDIYMAIISDGHLKVFPYGLK